MQQHDQESGLSEVIGFLLIISLLATLFSMYLVYVVPAQGREAEINHMDYIRDQFMDYKMTIDSLIINNRTGMPVTKVINPGAAGGKTTGSFSILPLSGSIGSSGSMSVNYAPFNTIQIDVSGDWNDPYTEFASWDGPSTPLVVEAPDTPLFAKIKVLDKTKESAKVIISSSSELLDNWEATIGIRNNTILNFNGTNPQNRFDLVMAVCKTRSNAQITYAFEDLIIQKDIQNSTGVDDYYYVNLLDEAYGLNRGVRFPYTISTQNTTPSALTSTIQIRGFPPTSSDNPKIEHVLGNLKYISNNYYWIQQAYTYTFDSIFLSQNEGDAVKMLPSVSLKPQPDGTMDVSIVNVFIHNEGNNNVVGTGSVQIVSRINSIEHNTNTDTVDKITLSDIHPNARQVEIFINSENYAGLFLNSFQRIRDLYLTDKTWMDLSNSTTTTVDVKIRDPTNPSAKKLNVDIYDVNLSVDLLPVKEV